MSDPAVTFRFDLKIDGLPLGTFTKVEGLSAKYEMKSVIEGGENGYVHQLPGRLTYENVKLTRPLDSQSISVVNWFARLAKGPSGKRQGAVITAFGPDHKPVAAWHLEDVFPVRYQGPSFDATGSSIPTESLELAHTGFSVGQ